MEIRQVQSEEAGCIEGFVVEMLGEVVFRESRHEACEAAMAVLEKAVEHLRGEFVGLQEQLRSEGSEG
ncbi:MAG: hypothetical protein ACYS1C_05720 [Planctomycetota bacterium]|jgi:hypothetical protein